MPTTPSFILACDIGGTHITSGIINSRDWTILQHTWSRHSIFSLGDAKSILQGWSSAIRETLGKFSAPINHVGIAMPGPFDYEKGISLMINQHKYDALYKRNVTEGLLEELSDRNLHIKYINDAAAFLQGEIFAQQLDKESKVLGITLGTGLGSAVWVNGQNAFDADLWNTPYKDSIFEEYLVTRWFTKRFENLTGMKERGLKEIIQKHQDSISIDILMMEYREHLKDFLDYFCANYQCSTLIIGGNIANAWDLIDDGQLFANFNIIKAQYAEKAALIGAASIYKDL